MKKPYHSTGTDSASEINGKPKSNNVIDKEAHIVKPGKKEFYKQNRKDFFVKIKKTKEKLNSSEQRIFFQVSTKPSK